jgi:lipopolysaccharide/colanic/teichoic acid biosynthesis glycosyltransferase
MSSVWSDKFISAPVAPVKSVRYEEATYQTGKRAFDIIFSAFFILLLSPVLLAIALLVFCKDRGPIVFKQKRVGLNGKEFTILKFRTMRQNAEEILRSNPALMEEYKKNFKLENDPRLIPGGKFLRSSSLDELPQLFNVFKGDMSLVGPRPILEAELEKYGDKAEAYLSMKPGCAGLWQCGGRSDVDYDTRVNLDAKYYETASLVRDVDILMRTAKAVVLRQGAY